MILSFYLAKLKISPSMLLVSLPCLFVSMCALYRSQFWTNSLQIFFLSRYLRPEEVGKISLKLVNGIMSKKIPENPKNPYLSSLQKFQKFITPPKLVRINSYLPGTCIGSISTLKKKIDLERSNFKVVARQNVLKF